MQMCMLDYAFTEIAFSESCGLVKLCTPLIYWSDLNLTIHPNEHSDGFKCSSWTSLIDEAPAESFSYAHVVGCIMFAQIGSRPNISHAMNLQQSHHLFITQLFNVSSTWVEPFIGVCSILEEWKLNLFKHILLLVLQKT